MDCNYQIFLLQCGRTIINVLNFKMKVDINKNHCDFITPLINMVLSYKSFSLIIDTFLNSTIYTAQQQLDKIKQEIFLSIFDDIFDSLIDKYIEKYSKETLENAKKQIQTIKILKQIKEFNFENIYFNIYDAKDIKSAEIAAIIFKNNQQMMNFKQGLDNTQNYKTKQNLINSYTANEKDNKYFSAINRTTIVTSYYDENYKDILSKQNEYLSFYFLLKDDIKNYLKKEEHQINSKNYHNTDKLINNLNNKNDSEKNNSTEYQKNIVIKIMDQILGSIFFESQNKSPISITTYENLENFSDEISYSIKIINGLCVFITTYHKSIQVPINTLKHCFLPQDKENDSLFEKEIHETINIKNNKYVEKKIYFVFLDFYNENLDEYNLLKKILESAKNNPTKYAISAIDFNNHLQLIFISKEETDKNKVNQLILEIISKNEKYQKCFLNNENFINEGFYFATDNKVFGINSPHILYGQNEQEFLYFKYEKFFTENNHHHQTETIYHSYEETTLHDYN